MKILVVPDIHLKPIIIESANTEMSSGKYDMTVFLGDIVDDWGRQNNIGLYEKTLDALDEYLTKYPNSLFCWGNHDLAYIWDKVNHPGFSSLGQPIIKSHFEDMSNRHPNMFKIMHRVDNVVFSHAGLTDDFLKYTTSQVTCDLDNLITEINQLNQYPLWDYTSPIWARPDAWIDYIIFRTDYIILNDCLQVVGHSPVKTTTYFKDKALLICDNFSTYINGEPIGTEKLVWVDTISKEWGEV